MTLTPSTMLPLGTLAPSFTLIDVMTEQSVSFDSNVHGNALLLVFICNHCPYVVHIAQQFAKVCNAYQQQGINIIAVSSNDIDTYPADAPDKMKLFAAQYGFEFPYCFDADQAVAKAFEAACTPDFFLFDQFAKLAYRGRFDAATPGNDEPVTGQDLVKAMDAVLQGTALPTDQVASMGCNIKWR